MIVSWIKLVVIRSYIKKKCRGNTCLTGQFLTKIWLSSKLEVDLFRILLEDKSWVL